MSALQDIALDIEDYSMAKMGSVAVNAGLPPSEFRAMLSTLDVHEIMERGSDAVA